MFCAIALTGGNLGSLLREKEKITPARYFDPVVTTLQSRCYIELAIVLPATENNPTMSDERIREIERRILLLRKMLSSGKLSADSRRQVEGTIIMLADELEQIKNC